MKVELEKIDKVREILEELVQSQAKEYVQEQDRYKDLLKDLVYHVYTSMENAEDIHLSLQESTLAVNTIEAEGYYRAWSELWDYMKMFGMKEFCEKCESQDEFGL